METKVTPAYLEIMAQEVKMEHLELMVSMVYLVCLESKVPVVTLDQQFCLVNWVLMVMKVTKTIQFFT